MNLDIALLPSVALPLRRQLPDAPGIYFVLDPSGEVLYIGQARSLAARWRGAAHHRYQEVAQIDGVSIAWAAVKDADELADLERELIVSLQPRLNRAPITGRDTAPFPLRLPPELKADLEDLSRGHERSLNSEIVFALRQYVYGD